MAKDSDEPPCSSASFFCCASAADNHIFHERKKHEAAGEEDDEEGRDRPSQELPRPRARACPTTSSWTRKRSDGVAARRLRPRGRPLRGAASSARAMAPRFQPIDIGHADYVAVVEPDTAFWALVRREKLAELALGGPLSAAFRKKAGPLRRGNARRSASA